MRLLVSWLRDFVDVQAPATEIGERLGLRGFELAGIEALGADDAVIDFEITANRPDCLSVVGLAREVATLYDLPLKTARLLQLETGHAASELLPNELRAAAGAADLLLRVGQPEAREGALHAGLANAIAEVPAGFQITIEDAELCPRYAAAIAEVRVGEAPRWMAARLQAAGIRSISSIVDITNYVLVELGHPTHAFDLERLSGPEIRVRRAAARERIRTLDDVERELDAEMLVIADRDRAQAVAGVMGGGLAEVSASTRLVVFESAYFKPASVRRTSKRLNLKTEASSRFERGADISAPVAALKRIAELLQETGAGRVVAPVLDVYPLRRNPLHIPLRRTRLASLLGTHVPDREVERVLSRLGLEISSAADGWMAVVPTARVDLQREVDLIEEVGRHFGLEKLPATFPVVTAPAPAPDPAIRTDQTVRRALTAAGFDEAVTFGIIEARAAEAFAGELDGPAIAIANPLSGKFDTLRPSLLPGLVDAVAHNRRHGRDQVALFEVGRRFSKAGETRAMAIAWTGSAVPPHWSVPAREVDFFDLKGAVELVCAAIGIEPRYEPGRVPFLVPGRTASVIAEDGSILGLIGQLTPAVADARGLPRQDAVFVAEIDLDRIAATARPGSETVRSLPRHPLVVRDLSVVVADTLPAGIIRGTIQAAGRATPAPLVGVAFFDRYQGKGIADGSVSLSIRLTFQALDRTLTDLEVQASVEQILGQLVQQHSAVQR
jgi:phenylalanyl-tRNA synthetase beta chain